MSVLSLLPTTQGDGGKEEGRRRRGGRRGGMKDGMNDKRALLKNTFGCASGADKLTLDENDRYNI